jgi:hypothetical protein
MFQEMNKGKIIIHVEDINGKLNSNMEYRGIAKKTETALSTLLVNFVSLSIEKGKDPKKLFESNLNRILEMIDNSKAQKEDGDI